MGENGIKPITECFLKPNYLMAIEFAEGWIFGRVARRRICHYKPWRLIDSAGSNVDIAASSHQAELRFRDPRNTEHDILFLDATTNNGYPVILHGGIGIRPSQINMYPRMPEGKDIYGKFIEIDPIHPGDGDDTAYVSWNESPYEEPTNWVEYVIPPKQHMGAEYYNKDSARAHQPVLNLLFATYWFEVLKPTTHPRLISSVAARAVPAAFLTVGFGSRPLDMGSTLQKDWDITPMSLDEALGLR